MSNAGRRSKWNTKCGDKKTAQAERHYVHVTHRGDFPSRKVQVYDCTVHQNAENGQKE